MKNHIILWIDDMEGWADIVQSNIEIIALKYGVKFNFVRATNGEEILQLCMQYNFDLVLMDYHMEPNNGEKYIRDIRAEDHLEHIPIVFYSQDVDANLADKIKGLRKITTVFRPNLEEKIRELFLVKKT